MNSRPSLDVMRAEAQLTFVVAHHAECLAVKPGGPFGTLVLTLSVITIEVLMISARILGWSNNPTLARDTMFAAIMIVLNGMVGITLLLGALLHVEQRYNLQGANAYLSLVIAAGDAEPSLAPPHRVDSDANTHGLSVGVSDSHELGPLWNAPRDPNRPASRLLRPSDRRG